MSVISRPNEPPPVIDAVSVSDVAAVRFNWAAWLSSINRTTIESARWVPSAGLLIGDGVTPVDVGLGLNTPPGPSIAEQDTIALFWVDGLEVGAWATIACQIKAGDSIEYRTCTVQVRDT